MPAVGEVEHPEQGHLVVTLALSASDRSIDSALAELRLALGVLVDVEAIRFENAEDAAHDSE